MRGMPVCPVCILSSMHTGSGDRGIMASSSGPRLPSRTPTSATPVTRAWRWTPWGASAPARPRTLVHPTWRWTPWGASAPARPRTLVHPTPAYLSSPNVAVDPVGGICPGTQYGSMPDRDTSAVTDMSNFVYNIPSYLNPGAFNANISAWNVSLVAASTNRWRAGMWAGSLIWATVSRACAGAAVVGTGRVGHARSPACEM
jgi:hypothetical protein